MKKALVKCWWNWHLAAVCGVSNHEGAVAFVYKKEWVKKSLTVFATTTTTNWLRLRTTETLEIMLMTSSSLDKTINAPKPQKQFFKFLHGKNGEWSNLPQSWERERREGERAFLQYWVFIINQPWEGFPKHLTNLQWNQYAEFKLEKNRSFTNIRN